MKRRRRDGYEVFVFSSLGRWEKVGYEARHLGRSIILTNELPSRPEDEARISTEVIVSAVE